MFHLKIDYSIYQYTYNIQLSIMLFYYALYSLIYYRKIDNIFLMKNI